MRQQLGKHGKRFLVAVLMLLFTVGTVLVPDTEAGADNLIISLSAKSVKIGDTLTVTVSLPKGVTGTVNLTYPEDLFTFDSASAENSVNAGTVAMTLGSYENGSSRASGSVKLKAKAAGDAGIAASAPSAGNQEGDRVSLGGASVKVSVENASGGNSEQSGDASLSSLTISAGKLSPAFSAGTKSYTAEVENDVTSLAVSAQPKDAKATVESVTGADNLSVGSNTVTIVVKAENGVKETYTITVTRQEGEEKEEPASNKDTEKNTETGRAEHYFTIDGVNLYPMETIPENVIPEGFVQDKVMLWDREYPCLRRDGDDTPLGLLYLADENGENPAFYMTELENPTNIFPFVCVSYEQFMHTMEEETAEAPVSENTNEEKTDENLKSQNRMILCGAGILVLILLIIIVVLIVKRKSREDDDDYYDDEEEEEPEEEEEDLSDESAGVSKRYEKESFGKSGFLHKILAGIDDIDDEDDDLDDAKDDDLEDEKADSKEEPRGDAVRYDEPSVKESLSAQDKKEQQPEEPGNDRIKKKHSKKDSESDDSDDDIEFIDL